MNVLTANNYVNEMECGANFSYILTDDNLFLSTEYKVLQSQGNNCFVKCMKMSYNGNIQLYYNTKGLKTLASILPTLDIENLFTVIGNLLSNIISVKHNGFLLCRNIDASFQRIYVDPSTLKVSFVYCPLSKHLYEDGLAFENEIRSGFIKAISGVSELSGPSVSDLLTALSNGNYTVEDLYSRVVGDKTLKSESSQKPSEDENSGKAVSGMRIVAMNAPVHIEIAITKDDFVLGKKMGVCDGVIGFNKMISRSHCRINKKGSVYTITDLKSANGTYVNKLKLQPDQPYPIKNGDVIRMANSDFQVCVD